MSEEFEVVGLGDAEIVELGDARKETKQRAPGGPVWDFIYGASYI